MSALVCVCMRACVRWCVRACVCVYRPSQICSVPLRVGKGRINDSCSQLTSHTPQNGKDSRSIGLVVAMLPVGWALNTNN